MSPVPAILLALRLLPGLVTAPADTDSTAKVLVLSIELNNLHKTEPDTSLAGRIQRLTTALRRRLTTACGYQVVALDSVAEASAQLTEGYLYEHIDVSADLAREAGAEWAVVRRLNRATAWAADLQANLVRASDRRLISNRIVELKGLELGPELADRLVERGAAWMADQISQAIELARHPGGEVLRRCPPSS